MRLTALFAFCLALLLSGCGEKTTTDPKSVTPPTVSNPLQTGGTKTSVHQDRAD
jgi:hypothetical protein